MSSSVAESQRQSGSYEYSLRDEEKSTGNVCASSYSSLLTPCLDDHASAARATESFVQNISSYGRPSPEFFDPNYDSDDTGFAHTLFPTGPLEDDSPYPEVRAAVANFDDPDMPVSTLRAWTLGIFWAIVLPGINQFFYFRYPSIMVTGLVVQLLAFPMGRLWAYSLPAVRMFGISLNPGPFTIKEHVLITIMAGVGAQTAYATDIIAVQKVYYNQSFNFIYQWMLVMSTQLIGFSIGGVARRFLVAPPSMIWPNTLVMCALFNTLHSQTYAGPGALTGMTRERFFTYAFLCSMVWYLLPGYLFQALSMFSWVCWIVPNNVVVNQLFGYRSGLGLSMLSFDWNQIAFTGSPICQYTNVWHSQYLPISSRFAYDNTGQEYNVSRIINTDASLNVDAYKEYSPLFLSMTFAISYGLSFASITATITHSLIHFWKPIKIYFGRSLREQPDIHAQLMSRYAQVALLPPGMIQAITNRQVGLNVLSELIVGFMLPGKPVAMMMCTWAYITMSQAMVFTADFKLGHYMKVPPRPMFWAQIIATIIAGTTQLGVQTWMFTHIPGLCNPNQKDHFVCANTQVFGTASIVWGVVGPSLQFAKGQLYYALTFFFLIGAVLPIILWWLTRRYPHSWLNYINLMFAGLGTLPPANASNFVPWAILGFIFQYVIRRRHFPFWAKYNYVLSAALDAGTTVGVLLVYFCLQYPLQGGIGRDNVQKWWGNSVFMRTADWNSPALKVSEGPTFGPTSW
ncbi:oligopeptide transporter [Heterobasidion irregulare TC 32-1]|uniref:Oligopeptide transporter n=1 Tax=Heterobasidion irregulare (strain TC 32-1) TaxID=747525 RepID=W4JP98_HETIT|nr:oligopeptide transporter [Heterobasidion irregulare TC 32-1]ETW75392.1 oligopeptide transporter [Heterobasidion irregulare TC 32-1]